MSSSPAESVRNAAIVRGRCPAGGVGMWTGILDFSGNLSGIAAPLATGVLISRTGSCYPGFVVAVLLAGVPSCWLVKKEVGCGKLRRGVAALSKATGEPLLFAGEDSTKTDVRRARSLGGVSPQRVCRTER